MKTPAKADWVRTAGGVGDNSMQEADEWCRSGAGVSEEVKIVGSDPNEGLGHGESGKVR